MSGIEVAGLVLGAFPVAIWALEQYRDVARRMGFWYEIRSEYQRSNNELKFHRLSFERNLEQLLFPIVSDESQLQDLIAEPGGPGWHNPAIQQALEKRLQKSYQLYLEILDEMRQAMQELNKELSVDNTQLQSRVRNNERDHHAFSQPATTSKIRKPLTRSNREYQLFRIKFSLGESTRIRLFSELQTYNDRLEKLTLTSDAVSELQADHKNMISTSATSAMVASLCKFWNHADRLYNALMGAWGCNCYEQHFAELILQHRQPLDNDFLITFCPGQQEGNGIKTGSWSRCTVRLQALEQKQMKTSNSLSPKDLTTSGAVSLSTPRHRSQQPIKTAFAKEKKTKKVQTFAHGTIHSISKSNTSTLIFISKQQPPVQTENIVDSLCKTLGGAIMPRSFINCDDDIRYHLTPEPWPATNSSICLSEILLGVVKPLTRRQRYHLSMTIASSFVQLKDTPWLQTPWRKDGVYFSRAEDQNSVLLDAPFIVRSFTSTSPNSTAEVGDDVAGIASLGIVLLELCFGKSIDQHPSRLKFPNGDDQARAAFDLITALEWLKDVNDEAGVDYSEAVEWCLAGCRTLPDKGVWRRLMVQKVVVPLERCYNYLNT
ncbi:hypothetical protein F5Y19DRAFT_408285 [Xylariaceae sp. FL1651]|nr:hypothetical protein F5Y19DRAFT_408285 [Xylariaceae sp. FL1651]